MDAFNLNSLNSEKSTIGAAVSDRQN